MKKYVIEKEYLTFGELIERWGFSKADIHHLIASQRLVPSIIWNFTAEVCTLESNPYGSEVNLASCRDPNNGERLIVVTQGWMYLRLPIVTGAHDKYHFTMATHDPRPVSECTNPGSWYRLIGDESNRSHKIDAEAVEQDAVFMTPMVDSCEATFQTVAAPPFSSIESTNEDDNLITPTNTACPRIAISGDTFSRIQKAVEMFPNRYPNYTTLSPKLDGDVRNWLKVSGLAKNDTEKRVFGTILFEHFKLSPNTRKNQ